MSLSNIHPVLFTLTSTLVAAQVVPTPVVELDPVDVSASRITEPSLTVPSLAAARADLALTPGGAEVVDSERYLRGRAATLADTFALSAGVFAQSRFGSDEARLSIRGSGLQRTFHGRGVRVLQDGVPVNLADGGFDMQSIEPVAASYINVWRGGNALAHGGSTLGGAIDYVSRDGRNSPGAFARLELGSWSYLRATVAGGVATDSADAYGTFTRQQQDGFRDHARQNNHRFFANVGFRHSDNIETRLHFTAVKTDSEIPGNLTKAQLEADPTQANPGNLAGDQKRDYELLRVASKTAFTTGADTTVNLVAAWTYKDLDHPIFQVVDQLSNDFVVGITFSNTSDLLGRAHLLRGGVLFNHGETAAANFTNVGGARGALLTKDALTAANLEAYFESQLELGAGFTGVLGANFSRNRRDAARVVGAATPANTYDRVHERFSPKLGLRWDDAARDIQLYANVSGSHEPPSFSEAGATAVANRAQRALTYELGTRGVRRWLRWDASVYHAEIRDELLAITLPGPVTGTLNADRTIHQGVEFATEIDLLGGDWKTSPDRRLVARAAWTYGRFKFDDDATYGNNTIAGLPPHLVRGELLHETRSGWYAGPTFEWVPVKSQVDHANTLSADPYALLGFKIGRRLDTGLSWFVEARNLLDERYAATTGVIENAGGLDQPQFAPGDGRAVYAGIEYRF